MDQIDHQNTVLASLRSVVEAGNGELISQGKLLPERQLTDVLGVSRRSVRQALLTLEKEGLVFRRQGQGTFIKPVLAKRGSLLSLADRTSPLEIMEVRKEIEPVLCRLAALRASQKDIELMFRLIKRGAESATADELDRWDRAFHSKIADCARNILFTRIFKTIDAVRTEEKWPLLKKNSFSLDNRKNLAAQHHAIASAIRHRDPSEAETAMREHLAYIARLVGC